MPRFSKKGLLKRKFDEFTKNDIETVLASAPSDYNQQIRGIIITLYCFGLRQHELLDLQGENFAKKNGYLILTINSGFYPRKIRLQIKKYPEFLEELWVFSRCLFPKAYVFFYFRTSQGKLNYHFAKWFSVLGREGKVTPHHLRINAWLRMFGKPSVTRERISRFMGTERLEEPYEMFHDLVAEVDNEQRLRKLAKFFED